MAVVMDFTGIVGLILGFVLIVFGIVFQEDPIGFNFELLGGFLNVPSLLITIGGTMAATICSFPISAFKNMVKHFVIANGKNKYDPKKYIGILVEFATDARKKGILSLEDKVMEQEDPFLRKSIMLVVDAIDPVKTKQILENELDCIETRHQQGFKIYEKASGFAPAFGMIGTLVGLVNMLSNLDLNSEDGASTLTSGMATALITTFYGSVFANLVLTPFANKLRARHGEEMLCKEIIVEGVLSIQAGDNPKHIEERLNAYLEPAQRTTDAGSSGDSDGDGDEAEGGKKKKKK